jgi:hypothetical protein
LAGLEPAHGFCPLKEKSRPSRYSCLESLEFVKSDKPQIEILWEFYRNPAGRTRKKLHHRLLFTSLKPGEIYRFQR